MLQLNVNDVSRTGLAITFEMQPILTSAAHGLFGYELLYRGPRPANWPLVDTVLLNYVQQLQGPSPTLFINLSNETILSKDIAAFVPMHRRATTYFELTEAITDAIEYSDVAKRVNALTAQGIRFAIDDFGSGLDGLHRYAALAEVAYVKLDRIFLQQASQNPTTRRIVEMLIQEWDRANTCTIAEGIETPAELAFARSLGVQMVQGYLVDAIYRSTFAAQVGKARTVTF